MNSKITEQHRSRPAYIYVRQSTNAQVLHHQESTERQYALRAMALELGWSESAIRTLDRDLGMTGTEMTRREDFKTLVADVSMGQVGAVFALEVSRLARSNLDWHRLLELCALTATLVIDEDGCCDPSDFNDGLLLGLKGTMAQAELHFLHARLQGGKLNKAKKGELRFPLPVGYCYDEQGRIVPDADAEVRGAVELVFRLFRETGSAYAVVHRFSERGLRFPKRAYGGAWDGKIIWGRLSHSRVLGLLKNPSYAGSYVFGRYQYRREINLDGEVRKRLQAVETSAWRVSFKQHHEGYITLEEFAKNREQLQKNRTNGEETLLSGPAREGLALLQGLLVCGNCGHALTVRYRGNGGICPTYQCNLLRREGMATKSCMVFRCDLLDGVVAEEMLKALQPAELELALAALHELESRDQGILRQWQMRLERAEYEAVLAERRYQEVDPANRLVAGTLERRWNDALLHLLDRLWAAKCGTLGKLIRYADDFVVMATTESKAKEALRQIQFVMSKLGLVLHPEKTRMVDLRRGKGSFVFLGCTIRKKRSILRNPRAYYMHRWPSPKATKRLRDRVREITGRRASGEDVKQILAKLNPVLRGWGNYFRSGTSSREFLKMDSFVYERLVRWLHRRGGQRATRRVLWTAEQFHGMGLHRLRGTVRYPAQAASVRSSLSRVRENRTHGLKGVC